MLGQTTLESSWALAAVDHVLSSVHFPMLYSLWCRLARPDAEVCGPRRDHSCLCSSWPRTTLFADIGNDQSRVPPAPTSDHEWTGTLPSLLCYSTAVHLDFSFPFRSGHDHFTLDPLATVCAVRHTGCGCCQIFFKASVVPFEN